MKLKRLVTLIIFVSLFYVLEGAINFSAFADTKSTLITLALASNGQLAGEAYTLTIPSTLNVKTNGWNLIGQIHAIKDGTDFDTTRKLVITASSDNGFMLKSDSNSLSYTLTTQENGAQTTTWEFTADEINATNGTSKDIGITVTWNSSTPKGSYTDTITYDAKIADADTTSTGKTITLTSDTGAVTLKNGDTLTGTGGEDTHVMIAAGATITLKDAAITSIIEDEDDDGNPLRPWAGITPLGDATIILEGTNTIKGGHEIYPGIFAAVNSTLTIKGEGTLTAESNGYGAGIGGGNYIDCGNIVIEGGTITATGGTDEAGIGSGYNASCGTITISGGTITANGGYNAAGIGGGSTSSSCGTITITSGVTSVTATKGDNAPNAIGAGYGGSCDGVNIENGANVIQN